jgi:hypothetical protein
MFSRSKRILQNPDIFILLALFSGAIILFPILKSIKLNKKNKNMELEERIAI